MNYPIRLGEVRPSQILYSYGIGSLLDLPALSVMVMGMDEWDMKKCIPIAEERLLQAVRKEVGYGVQRLVMPPVSPDQDSPIGVPVVAFPRWMVCSRCHVMATVNSGLFKLKTNPKNPTKIRFCHETCSEKRGVKPPIVTPVRFLVACNKGHLDDFPWDYFVHGGHSSCKSRLRLDEFGVAADVSSVQ